MSPNTIETVGGHFVDLLEPDPATIMETDIAWSLSRMPRFAGHTLTPLAYTVGQHSVVVMKLGMRLKDPKEVELRDSFASQLYEGETWDPNDITAEVLLEMLLHDASEAYLLDVPTPLKRLPGMKEVYGEIEARMMSAIRVHFKLPEPSEHVLQFVKWADAYALTIEAYHLMLSRGTQWTRRLPVELMALQQFEHPKTGPEVYSDFMAWVDELQHARRAPSSLPGL